VGIGCGEDVVVKQDDSNHQHAVNLLIELGGLSMASASDREAVLAALSGFGVMNRLGTAEWMSLCQDLSDTDLEQLFKGAVIAEVKFSWSGGSVAAAIWIFRAMGRRGLKSTHALSDWAMQTTNNPYVPFGTSNFGARSFIEYHECIVVKASNYERHVKDEVEAKSDRSARTAERAERAEHHRTQAQERRARLAELQVLSILDRLVAAIDDNAQCLSYYPQEWVSEIDDDVLAALDGEKQMRLRSKSASLHRGAWCVYETGIYPGKCK
jgi:hypothetical protein